MYKNESKFKNGDFLEDIVTGFKGVVMVVAFYSTGCIHYGLQDNKMNKDGLFNDWQWLDSSRLRLLEKDIVEFEITDKPSGPMPKGPQV